MSDTKKSLIDFPRPQVSFPEPPSAYELLSDAAKALATADQKHIDALWVWQVARINGDAARELAAVEAAGEVVDRARARFLSATDFARVAFAGRHAHDA